MSASEDPLLDSLERTLSDLSSQLSHTPPLPSSQALLSSAHRASLPLLTSRTLSPRAIHALRALHYLGALLAAYSNSPSAFETHAASFRTFFFDFAPLLPAASSPPPAVPYSPSLLFALSLLRLLAQNRIAEFHSDLERVLSVLSAPPPEPVAFVLDLERLLTEGAYVRVVASRSRIPNPAMAPFFGRLLDTVRDEVAACAESSYEKIGVSVLAEMMWSGEEMSPAEKEKRVRDEAGRRGWTVEGAGQGAVVWFGERREKEKEKSAMEVFDACVPAKTFIERALGYAKELERIV